MKVLAFVAMLGGCSYTQSPIPDSAEIFFRAFDATSIFQLDEEAISRSPGLKRDVEDRERIRGIVSMLDLPCEASSFDPARMDLRLLTGFEGGDGDRTWKASGFHYYDSSIGRVCTLPNHLVAALTDEFGATR